MKAVILAGGMGTRIAEETSLKPKPMVIIGGQPILWHIMKIYSAFNIREFIICCGYKGHIIKDYFLDYASYHCDVTRDLKSGNTFLHNKVKEPWKVTLVNTGLHTRTAGRLLRVREYLEDENFFVTYGDGVADIDIKKLLEFHRSHHKIATVTVARPSGRFGTLDVDEQQSVNSFHEKPEKGQSWVNAGFAVFTPNIFEYLGDGLEMLEEGPYEQLVESKEMKAYFHPGRWAPMDTIHEKQYLESLWKENKAFWKIWRDN